jgi:hypothetical protein
MHRELVKLFENGESLPINLFIITSDFKSPGLALTVIGAATLHQDTLPLLVSLSRLCIYRKWLAQCFNIDLLRG